MIRNILNVYEKADSTKKVDIIIRYYLNFLGIVDSYTEGLRYMIENEKSYNRSKNRGDLGVRVQTSGKHSDITADTAISNVITKDAIIACDFSGDVLILPSGNGIHILGTCDAGKLPIVYDEKKKSYLLGDKVVDLVASKTIMGDVNFRVYTNDTSLEQVKELMQGMSPLMDEALSAADLNAAINEVDTNKTANGYYYGELGITLFGSDEKGYELMIKTIRMDNAPAIAGAFIVLYGKVGRMEI